MDKKVLYTVIGVGLTVVLSWSLLNLNTGRQVSQKRESKQTQSTSFQASISIFNIDNSLTAFQLKEEGLTALEALKKATNNQIETKGEGENAFVVSIKGRKPDESLREYWAFYINDKLSESGAGSYIVKNGDSIKWKIERY